MKIVFRIEIVGLRHLHRKLVFGAEEVELEMIGVAAAFQTLACFSFIRDEAIETGAEERLKAGLACVVIGKMVLLEGVGEETLRQVFSVFVVCLPLESDVFIRGF